MLYDLFFAFLQTGRYSEARKVIEVKCNNGTQPEKQKKIIIKAALLSPRRLRHLHLNSATKT